MDRALIWTGLALIAMGLLIVGLGLLVARGGRLLPGDIVISRPGFTFVFPLASALLVSLILTLILWAIAAWRR